MQSSHSTQRICYVCSARIWSLFKNGFCSTSTVCGLGSKFLARYRFQGRLQARQLTIRSGLQLSNWAAETRKNTAGKPSAEVEAVVLQTRQTFGDTLPKDFLSAEEYSIYERLYGPPIHETRPEDVDLLQMPVEDGVGEEEESHASWEDDKSNVEEGEYPRSVPKRNDYYETSEISAADQAGMESEGEENKNAERCESNIEDEAVPINARVGDFKTRIMLYRDMVTASQETTPVKIQWEGTSEIEGAAGVEEDSLLNDGQADLDRHQDEDRGFDGIESSQSADEDGDSVRTHPLTAVGRFNMSHTTLQIPRDTVVNPITTLLSDASNKQLSEVAQKTFGGPFLPNSTATPNNKGHLKQQPIALEASHRMGEMEANSYLAAVTPGIYAVVMSCLVEIRKRLGPDWLKGLLSKDGGPRILDAGGAGAGVLAWRDLLNTEWKILHPDGVPQNKPLPVGKTTVVVGSAPLRTRMSRLLENTTFLPRLPDYNPSSDRPSAEETTAVPRKKYDIVVAPHTLWTLKEDYKRKNQVQNFWSLLEPTGGVLLIVEKGVPRGFELIGGARDVLLKHHIASPRSETAENRVEEPYRARFREKETGMIIAPCTNHLKCPMYLVPGKTTGRKDYCHFSQRYIRPQFLQRILGVNDRNHEDIRYSYVAVQRGKDQRQDFGILQGKAATDAAFQGYEGDEPFPDELSNERLQRVESQFPGFHPLSLPRTILSPIKPQRHIILDLCTPMGQIERWTVPKSFSKQAYRDARKSRWGDLWALGAKTRVSRNIRLGKPERKPKGNTLHKADEDYIQQSSGPRANLEKRTERERKPKSEIYENDL